MFKSRQLVFSTLVFALLPPFMLRGASSAIEYVGGTVKEIPANATGTFNFDDAKELRFNYGQSSLRGALRANHRSGHQPRAKRIISCARFRCLRSRTTPKKRSPSLTKMPLAPRAR